MAVRQLNMGCGFLYREGWLNLDKFHENKVDILADLEQGLPFNDGAFDYIYASHILEHIHRCADLINDVHRVLKTGGTFEVYVPYGMKPSLYHVQYFFLDTLDLFIESKAPVKRRTFEGSSKPLFRQLEREITEFAVPGWWHIKRYFNISILKLPLWKRKEIHWILEKI